MSFRRINMIAVISATSGAIKWKWADGTTAHQHDVNFTEQGTITIFDNGAHRRGIDFSRALEVDARTREILWEYTDNPPFSFYTIMGGSARRLPNGNTLICETAKGHLFEVTPDKKVVWEYINPFFVTNPRLGGRINMVFRTHRYGADHAALVDKDLDPARHKNLNRLYT